MSNQNIQRRQTINKVTADAVDMTRRMTCGGLAGMIAKTATAPLERIKMLSQTGEHGLSKTNQSISTLFRSIIANEGVVGLWAGNGANLLRIFPAKGVVFASNDFWRNQCQKYLVPSSSSSSRQSKEDKTLPGHLSFLSGGLSGTTATAVTYPLDFARGRMSGKLATDARTPRAYKGIVNTITLTVKDEGFMALYKGATPTLLGAIPYEGIKFGTVGVLEVLFPVDDLQSTGSGVWRKVCFGGVGGVMAGLITYPNDTVRRMLQLQGSRGTVDVYTGYWDCVRKVYSRYG
eukprot:CAMPEP_0172481530 /NCGR_PEP_ID=MMETSP1066-20121228/7471_1 /TAXON_ID=671091 /ORGANISM="Coscinodiscus wailesii, Strain CCMP2513" /LENGTH=289 /DNA_ID=CAMNT_0013243905 /DNA_START=90 /DNA_END=956 /DNA_ORIENTATION=-